MTCPDCKGSRVYIGCGLEPASPCLTCSAPARVDVVPVPAPTLTAQNPRETPPGPIAGRDYPDVAARADVLRYQIHDSIIARAKPQGISAADAGAAIHEALERWLKLWPELARYVEHARTVESAPGCYVVSFGGGGSTAPRAEPPSVGVNCRCVAPTGRVPPAAPPLHPAMERHIRRWAEAGHLEAETTHARFQGIDDAGALDYAGIEIGAFVEGAGGSALDLAGRCAGVSRRYRGEPDATYRNRIVAAVQNRRIEGRPDLPPVEWDPSAPSRPRPRQCDVAAALRDPSVRRAAVNVALSGPGPTPGEFAAAVRKAMAPAELPAKPGHLVWARRLADDAPAVSAVLADSAACLRAIERNPAGAEMLHAALVHLAGAALTEDLPDTRTTITLDVVSDGPRPIVHAASTTEPRK